jgi:ribosomal protein S18 acetylase RimI-like enzyme
MVGEPIRFNRSNSSAKGSVYYAVAGEPHAAFNGGRFSHPAGKPLHPKIMQDPNPMSLLSSSSSSGSTRPVSDPSPLDNPIWHALVTEQSSLALGSGLARRFPAEIGPLCGMENPSAASYDALRTLAGPGEILALFFTEPATPPAGWTMAHSDVLDQMICREPRNPGSSHVAPESKLRRLAPADVPAMLELATLTEPGPFNRRTIELGIFFGIFDSGRLLAMAGQRMHLPEFVEVSAVCTHPDARGRGYARTLMIEVMKDIRQRGKTPFLHVRSSNLRAISVYEGLGFTLRRKVHLAVLKNDG